MRKWNDSDHFFAKHPLHRGSRLLAVRIALIFQMEPRVRRFVSRKIVNVLVNENDSGLLGV
jgi:hypothetical protein